jgi:ABC-2 type transport system ATP-binding protein
MNVVEVRKLRKEWESLVAVDDVSFEIPAGAVVALVGPNGAGKSTLMKMIAGLLEPSNGTALIAGIDVRHHPREVHRHLGFLPDFFGTYDDLSVSQYMDFFARAYGFPEGQRQVLISEVIQAVGLEDKTHELITHLSRGMTQRVAIARTLINRPKLLLLDEPAAGLDPEARHQLQILFQKLASRGHTLIVSSHILTELEEYSSHVAMMQNGKIIKFGRIQSIREQKDANRRIRVKTLGDFNELSKAIRSLGFAECAGYAELKEVMFEFSGSDEELSKLLRQLIEQQIPILSFGSADGNIQDAYLHFMKGSST